MRHKQNLRMMQWGIAILSLLLGALTLFHRNYNIGVVVLLLYGAGMLALLNSKQKTLKKIIAGVLAAGTIGGGVLSVYMMHAAYLSPPAGELPQTVVVLGCQVRGTDPSLMLKRRLDVACEYLLEHPDTKAVVCGGLGEQATLSEAEVMRRYLQERGIAAERIFLEDQSHSTEQNLAFAAQIIEAENLPENIAIATDGFHQARAAVYAQRLELVPSALPSRTPPGILPAYWIREWFGLLKALLLDA